MADSNGTSPPPEGDRTSPSTDFRRSIGTLPARLRRSDSRFARRLGTADRVTLGVVGLVVVGLVARLVFLGARTAHYDEGRVGYWILHFVETGEFHYRYIIHGPFVQHVNAALFPIIGANDFTLRLVVALIGAVLPLAALLLREHLDGPEVVAVAFFLALDPAMLYYSRFFRSTIPVAAFSFVAFALLVRFSETRRLRYLHGAVFFVALAFTAKESAAIYVLVWIGAGALLLDHTLFRPGSDTSGLDLLDAWWGRNVTERDWRDDLPRYLGHAVLAILLFLVVVVYFYAPRAGDQGGVGLWSAIGSGNILPLLEETWQSVSIGLGYWFGGGVSPGQNYGSVGERFSIFFGSFSDTLLAASGPLVAFAALGFLAERFASRRRRYLVMFASYWGIVSAIGYPLGADINNAAWITVNVIVPLSIPAAVGVGLLYRWGLESWEDEDRIGAAIVGVVLALVVFQVVATGVSTSFLTHSADDNPLVQYAQPADDLQPTMRDIDALAETTDGTDVLFYGDFVTGDRPWDGDPACADIWNTLPLQWYLARADASAACADTTEELDTLVADGPPPVVIVEKSEADAVAERLPDYERRTLFIRTRIDELTYFLDTDRLDPDG